MLRRSPGCVDSRSAGGAVNFLRRRRDRIERCWVSDKPTAVDKAGALFVLGQNVIVVRHPYDRHPQSGAGNCWCGDHQGASIHNIVVDVPAGTTLTVTVQ